MESLFIGAISWMIRERFYITIDGKPWYITIFLPITRCHVSEIMDALYSIGINRENYEVALGNLTSGKVNNGITFSNPLTRETVSVWAKAVSKEDCFDLILHELHHLSVQIAEASGFDLSGEEVCYINGGVGRRLYRMCLPLIT